MRAVLPLFGSRVSPNLLFSNQSLIVQIRSSQVVSKKIISTAAFLEADWIKVIEEFDIDVLVCGGIDKKFQNELEQREIEVIYNVAGEIDEVLEHLINKKLKNGYGISYLIKQNNSNNNIESAEKSDISRIVDDDQTKIYPNDNDKVDIDCFACLERSCLKNETCQFCPLQAIDYDIDEETAQLLDVAHDISFEPERVLCRVSELVYFCLGMNYKHIGIAFCTEMWREAELVSLVLKRFFSISSVCCKIGSTSKDKENGQFPAKKFCCNPLSLTNILNMINTDLNVSLGLCMGCDIVFNKKSKAPVTTLFVKDKLLAHNPVGAVYTKYALEHLEEEF